MVERLTDNVVVTIVVGDKAERIFKKTEPFLRRYAERIGADFLILDENLNVPSPHWIKFSLYEILRKKYKRAIYLDCDLIIRNDCPNLFDVVPENELGLFNEGRFTPRQMCIYEIKNAYKIDLPNWDQHSYYNTGVMVVSKEHRYVFKPPQEVKYIRNSYGEQTFVNFRIFQSDVKIHELDYKFNRMSLMDKILGVSRLDSYIIHYAGAPNEKILFKTMDNDIARWIKDGPNYKYHPVIFINVGGGLGDQVCAEPVIRYIHEKLYPDAEIYGITAYPRLFEHIEGVQFDVKMPDKKFDAVYSMDTHPDERTPFKQYTIHTLSHPVDYISLTMLRRILPDEDKQITLSVHIEDFKEFFNLCDEPQKIITIHPGKGWESKTFPIEWWQKIIDNLSNEGYKLAIIGKEINEEHTVLPVICPKGSYDLRNKLSLGGLLALLSQSPVLLSNDSAPIHLAGAFDNNIILIPTCKHHEHLLPYRKGRKNFKTCALFKELACEDFNFVPNSVASWSIIRLKRDINEYLPTPEKVTLLIRDLMVHDKCHESIKNIKEKENVYNVI